MHAGVYPGECWRILRVLVFSPEKIKDVVPEGALMHIVKQKKRMCMGEGGQGLCSGRLPSLSGRYGRLVRDGVSRFTH